jgi:hypothetical protein
VHLTWPILHRDVLTSTLTDLEITVALVEPVALLQLLLGADGLGLMQAVPHLVPVAIPVGDHGGILHLRVARPAHRRVLDTVTVLVANLVPIRLCGGDDAVIGWSVFGEGDPEGDHQQAGQSDGHQTLLQHRGPPFVRRSIHTHIIRLADEATPATWMKLP